MRILSDYFLDSETFAKWLIEENTHDFWFVKDFHSVEIGFVILFLDEVNLTKAAFADKPVNYEGIQRYFILFCGSSFGLVGGVLFVVQKTQGVLC